MDREHPERFTLRFAVIVYPPRTSDDLVAEFRNAGRFELHPPLSERAALDCEDLTGLLRAVSTRCPLPPKVTAGDATPLQVRVKERQERFRIALVEGHGRFA